MPPSGHGRRYRRPARMIRLPMSLPPEGHTRFDTVMGTWPGTKGRPEGLRVRVFQWHQDAKTGSSPQRKAPAIQITQVCRSHWGPFCLWISAIVSPGGTPLHTGRTRLSEQFFILSAAAQRPDHWQHLCVDRHRLHHGLRHHRHDQLRPRRNLCWLVCRLHGDRRVHDDRLDSTVLLLMGGLRVSIIITSAMAGP